MDKQELNVLYIHYYADQDDNSTAEELSIKADVNVRFHHVHWDLPKDTSMYDLVIISGLVWERLHHPIIDNLIVFSAAYSPIKKANMIGVPAVDKGFYAIRDLLPHIMEAKKKKYPEN